jgi:hypothetical protein
MSGFAERVVALAADQLPEPDRSRRSEEWSADLEGAKEHGLSRIGVALGALTFALRAPVASPIAADRWARWALTFAAIGPVVWLSLRTSGLYMTNPEIRDLLRPFMDVSALIAIALVVLVTLRTRGIPWAGSGAVILVCLSGLLWLAGPPSSSRFFLVVFTGLGLAFAALLAVALIARRSKATARAHVIALFSLSALPVLVIVWDASGPFGWWVPLVVALVAVVGTLIVLARRPRTDRHRPNVDARVARIAVFAIAVLILALTVTEIVFLTTSQPEFGAKAWTLRWRGLVAGQPPYGIAAIAASTLYIGLVSLSSRRPPMRGIGGLGLLLAAALAGLGSVVPGMALGMAGIWEPVSYGFALAGCVLAVAGAVLLIAPRTTEVPRLAEAQPTTPDKNH